MNSTLEVLARNRFKYYWLHWDFLLAAALHMSAAALFSFEVEFAIDHTSGCFTIGTLARTFGIGAVTVIAFGLATGWFMHVLAKYKRKSSDKDIRPFGIHEHSEVSTWP